MPFVNVSLTSPTGLTGRKNKTCRVFNSFDRSLTQYTQCLEPCVLNIKPAVDGVIIAIKNKIISSAIYWLSE